MSFGCSVARSSRSSLFIGRKPLTVLLDTAVKPIPLSMVTASGLSQFMNGFSDHQQRWVQTSGFRALPQTWCGVPGNDGGLAVVLVGVEEVVSLSALAGLAWQLPEADYCLGQSSVQFDAYLVALGFALGAYQFTRYKIPKRAPARLVLPTDVDSLKLRALVGATTLVRDLINTPTEDMGPAELAASILAIAKAHGAQMREWVGEQLLTANFPTIHAVGRASHRSPRLIEMAWGQSKDPKVIIVGKGVCFDTGGLDIKPSDGMRWMKKDMGGAAHAIALSELVMASRLPVRLITLIPAVENAIAGNAFRPGEVIRTRSGLTVEVDNTDAEGRLVLCDALSYAVEQQPDLILDFATLTGAARIALGPDLPALFTRYEDLANLVLQAGEKELDPLWRLPLWPGYRHWLESGIADLSNSAATRHAGAITAALYLERFVPQEVPWVHVDLYAWNDADRPGKPKGGEAQGLRAFLRMLTQRYSSSTVSTDLSAN